MLFRSGTNRAVYLANVLGVDMGMFYKRRDYSKIVDGRNPIVAHEFLGTSVEGKDVIIIDDMISSGESMIDVATELKKRNANRIFVVSTFGLFTNGLERFDKAVEDGTIYKVGIPVKDPGYHPSVPIHLPSYYDKSAAYFPPGFPHFF